MSVPARIPYLQIAMRAFTIGATGGGAMLVESWRRASWNDVSFSLEAVWIVLFPAVGSALTWVMLARVLQNRNMLFAAALGFASPLLGLIMCPGTLLYVWWFWYIACPVGAITGVIVNGLVPRRRPAGMCTHCGYDLTGNMSGRCSECGAELHDDTPTMPHHNAR